MESCNTAIHIWLYNRLVTILDFLRSRGVLNNITRLLPPRHATIEIEEVSESGDSERCCHEETKKTGQGRALRYCGVK